MIITKYLEKLCYNKALSHTCCEAGSESYGSLAVCYSKRSPSCLTEINQYLKKKKEMMMNDQESSQKELQTDAAHSTKRRDFLKKTLYAAPQLVALGALLKPTASKAESQIAPPPPWG